MPYPNVEDEETTRKIDSCVLSVMDKHKGEKGFKKSNAIAICYKQIVGEELPQAAFDLVTDLSALPPVVTAAIREPGELLRFKDAELARAEVNSNHDELNNADIDALAETLPLMPLTDEHGEVIGLFTAASSAPAEDAPSVNRLMTEGLVYARRFPDTANEIRTGVKKLSIEAMADRAVCSVCGGEFENVRLYCNHLRNRHNSGACRRFKGIRAVGGGAVRRPAGSKAGFNVSQVYMIASHQEEEVEVSEDSNLLTYLAVLAFDEDQPDTDVVEEAKKKWAQDVELDEGSLKALGWPSVEKIASAIESGKVSYAKAIQKLAYLANVTKDSATASKARGAMETLKKRFKGKGDKKEEGNKSEGGTMELDELKQQLADALAKLEAAQADAAKVPALEASIVELKAALEAEQSKRERLEAQAVEAARRTLLASVMSTEEFDSMKAVILAMSEEGVQLLAAKAKPAEPKVPTTPTTNLDDGSTPRVRLG